MAKSPTNILFILTDQQRWDTLGIANASAQTPYLDALAHDGVWFSQSFTCQPVCGPARSCIQTGRFATDTGCWENDRPLKSDHLTMAHHLKSKGYKTGYVGKWHLASDKKTQDFYFRDIPLEKRGGYDFWMASDLPEYISNGYEGVLYDHDHRAHPWKGYRSDVYTSHALSYLQEQTSDEPFFLFLSYVEPHPQPYHRLYQGPEPQSREGMIRDYMRYDAPEDDQQPICAEIPQDLLGKDGDWTLGYDDYMSCCRRLDQNVQSLCDQLEKQGLRENTLIVFSSDHGCHFNTRHTYNDKSSCHDNSVRVPMILNGPGFKGGHRVDRLASLIDLAPTVLKSAGISPSEEMQGQALQHVLEPHFDWPDSVYIQISQGENGRAVRTQDWKYAIRAKGPENDQGLSAAYEESYLYDLQGDPHEANNLVQDPRLDAVRSQLRDCMWSWMAKNGEGQPEIFSYCG